MDSGEWNLACLLTRIVVKQSFILWLDIEVIDRPDWQNQTGEQCAQSKQCSVVIKCLDNRDRTTVQQHFILEVLKCKVMMCNTILAQTYLCTSSVSNNSQPIPELQPDISQGHHCSHKLGISCKILRLIFSKPQPVLYVSLCINIGCISPDSKYAVQGPWKMKRWPPFNQYVDVIDIQTWLKSCEVIFTTQARTKTTS